MKDPKRKRKNRRPAPSPRRQPGKYLAPGENRLESPPSDNGNVWIDKGFRFWYSVVEFALKGRCAKNHPSREAKSQ
jgi:hypothetical protein